MTRDDALDRLAQYATRGAAGIRLNPTQRSPGSDPLAIWRRADELGLVVSCMGGVDETASDDFSELVAAFPGLPIILEHMAGGGEGAAFPVNGPGPQPPYTTFKKAVELARFPNTFIKVHGYRRDITAASRAPDEVRLRLLRLDTSARRARTRRVRRGRMMWGSDYPPVSQREGYRNALHGVMDNPAFDTQEDREWVMGKTALGVFRLE